MAQRHCHRTLRERNGGIGRRGYEGAGSGAEESACTVVLDLGLLVDPLPSPSQLMLSLGKLSQVAQANKQTLQSEQVQRAIEGELHDSSDVTSAPADTPFRFAVVDDRIDMVNSQELLFEIFSGVLSGSESRTSLEEQSQIIASRVAPILADRPAFAHVRCRG